MIAASHPKSPAALAGLKAGDRIAEINGVKVNSLSEMRHQLGPRYAGGAGFVHGGIIAVLLDEVMGKISKLSEEQAVTAELTIEYRKPVPTDLEIVVSGWQDGEKGRNRFRIGEIHDAQGNLLARGRARFVVVGQPVAAA